MPRKKKIIVAEAPKGDPNLIPWPYAKPNDDFAPNLELTGGLKVTSLQVYPLKEPSSKTRAFARCVLNDAMQLTGMRVVDGHNGLFVSYPNDPSYKGEDYRSLFYPVTKALREHIEAVILHEFCLQPYLFAVRSLGVEVDVATWSFRKDGKLIPRMDIPLLLVDLANKDRLSGEDKYPLINYLQSLM